MDVFIKCQKHETENLFRVATQLATDGCLICINAVLASKQGFSYVAFAILGNSIKKLVRSRPVAGYGNHSAVIFITIAVCS